MGGAVDTVVGGGDEEEGKKRRKKATRIAAGVTTYGLSEVALEGKKQLDNMKDAQKAAIGAARDTSNAIQDSLNKADEAQKELKKQKDEEIKASQEAAAGEEAARIRDSAREKQKIRSLGARGRRSTILTTGDEAAAPGARKTLLGQ